MGRIILGALLLLAAPIAFANSLTGKVGKITDGDTLYVLDTSCRVFFYFSPPVKRILTDSKSTSTLIYVRRWRLSCL